MKKLLISGFDPFGGEVINPSYEAVKLLPDMIGEYELTKIELPTVFGRAAKIMIEKIEEIRPLVPDTTYDYLTSPAGANAVARIKGCDNVIHH